MIRKRFPAEQNVYGRSIVFLYGTTKELNAVLARAVGSDTDMSAQTAGQWRLHRDEDGFETDYICIVKCRDKNDEIAYLAHEVLHHTFHVFRLIPLPLAKRTEEAYCYYQQWVFSQCLAAMRRLRGAR